MQSKAELERLADTYGGVPVYGALPGSPAARSGMRYGDIVVRINGRPTPNLSAYVQARSDCPGRTTVELIRQGATVELELVHEQVEPDMQQTTEFVVRDGTFVPPDAGNDRLPN